MHLNFLQQIRNLDPLCVTSMDTYAAILKAQGNLIELNKLCTSLYNSCDKRPETWTTMAIYYELKEDKPKAQFFISKARMLIWFTFFEFFF